MDSQHIESIVRSFGYLLNPESRARDGASACTIQDRPFDAHVVTSKWLDGPEDIKLETPRSTAFRAAYAMIFGDGILAQGVPTDDGKWFRPDHSVVRAAIRSGDMNLDRQTGILSLTDRAMARVADALYTLREDIRE